MLRTMREMDSEGIKWLLGHLPIWIKVDAALRPSARPAFHLPNGLPDRRSFHAQDGEYESVR